MLNNTLMQGLDGETLTKVRFELHLNQHWEAVL